jgi:peptide subunit release factor 1 (eRF1)
MAKDKTYEEVYKAEGRRRIAERQMKRREKFVSKRERKYPHDEYSCPSCGLGTMYCNSTAWYSFICPDCNKEFETPDT